MLELGPGCNGTPPMVYGVVWNPLRPSDGRKGSEFATYGVKHLKVWAVGDEVRRGRVEEACSRDCGCCCARCDQYLK